MKQTKSRSDHALVIGFFQSPKSGEAALKNLRRDRIRKSAAVHCSDTGEVQVDEHGITRVRGALAFALIAILLGILVLPPPPPIPSAIALLALQLAGWALAGTLVGWGLFRWLDTRLDAAQLAQFKRWIVRNESVVL